MDHAEKSKKDSFDQSGSRVGSEMADKVMTDEDIAFIAFYGSQLISYWMREVENG